MKEKKGNRLPAKTWAAIWLVGIVGQLCWNVENQWFNTFVYAKIAPDPSIISWMTAISALVTTFSTFLFGTMSDRIGKRKPFIMIGYVVWGLFTIGFGLTEFIPKNPLILAAIMVVAMDALMSFFGSMGNDCGFNSWTTDITNEHNRGQLGAAMAAQPVIATIVGTVVSGMIIEMFGYFVFFVFIGLFVSIIGVLGFFLMKESKELLPRKNEKGYWAQFVEVFNFKTFVKNKQLFLVFLITTIYFICFNIFFVHALNFFIYTLGFDEGMAGVLMGVGLMFSVIMTIFAIRFINSGHHSKVIFFAIISTFIGLLVIGLFSANTILLVIGIIFAGIGYVLMIQTTTAWQKNLFPDGMRGQFEGIRIIFLVLIPMVIGPAIATPIINNLGLDVVINGIAGKAPTGELFLVAGVLSLFTLIPLYFANRKKQRDLT